MKKLQKSIFSVFVITVLTSVCAAEEAEPIFTLNFERYKNFREASARTDLYHTGSGTDSILFYGKIVPQAGVNNSVALECIENSAGLSRLPLDGKEFSLEMKFKLMREPSTQEHSTLFAYAADKNFRRRMIAWILSDGRIEVVFEIRSEKKKVEKKFSMISAGIKWQTNKFYTLRFSCISGGTAELELDGKVIASCEENAMSPGDLRLSGEKPHSVLYFGHWPFDGPRRKQVVVLQGYVDDIKIYNKVIRKPADEKKSEAAAGSRSLIPHLCLDNQWSSPFLVADQPGKLLGTFQRAEEKFWQNAARVRARVENSNLIVEFDCPVPAGMKPECDPKFFWSGDRVELFIQPDPAVGRYLQYAVNAHGEGYAGVGMTKNNDSKAKFTAQVTERGFAASVTIPLNELGLVEMESGYMFKGNFMRAGKTAGGKSFWSPAGSNWHSVENFAPIICGSRKAYFERKLADVRKETSSSQGTRNIKEKIDALEQQIATQGDDPAFFNQLERQFSDMELSLVQLRFESTKQLIWQPQIWENHMNISRLARPLKTIRIRMPRNARRMVGFAVSNLERIPFLGQIKVFNRWPYEKQYFGRQEWNRFLAGIRFYEGLASSDINGGVLYDPIAPLPMNTVLRIPPRATAPVWMEISSQGLAPGKYTGHLVLKNCGGRGGVETALVEVIVSTTDIAKYHHDNCQGNSVMGRAWHHESLREFFLKYNYNYFYTIPPPEVYLKYDSKAKKWTVPETIAKLDEWIERSIRSGFDPENLKLCFYLCWEYKYAGVPDTPQWEKRIRATIPYWLERIEKKYGISNDRVVLWPIDEPRGDINNPESNMARALRWCRLLREIAPKAKIMVNPLYAGKTNVFETLAPYVDIFYCYRPELDNLPDFRRRMQKLGKEIWTYNILLKQQSPEIYRRDYWKNCRDGFLVTKFYDFDNCAGGDCFDPGDVTDPQSKRVSTSDYAMAYVDFNYGTCLASRRLEAAARGFDEMRVAWYCRNLLSKLEKQGADVKELKKELDVAITRGAAGSMSVMDAQSEVILSLSEKIIRLAEGKK